MYLKKKEAAEEEREWNELIDKINAEIEKGIENGEEGAAEARELMDFLQGLYEDIVSGEAK